MKTTAQDNSAPLFVEPRGGRRLDIQGLRAVAILMVVATHSGLVITGGFVGVDVFFVISGYIITAMLLRELDTSGRVAFGKFYARRAKRLLPALAVMLLATAVTSVVVFAPFGLQQKIAGTGMAASVMAANFDLYGAPTDYFAAASESNPYLHLWSLGVEEQFYLVFPALLAGLYVWSRRGRLAATSRLTLAIATMSVMSFVLSLVLSTAAVNVPRIDETAFAFYALPTRAWEFGLGALVAIGAGRVRQIKPGTKVGLGVLGAGMIATAAVLASDALAFPGWIALLPTLGATLLLMAGHGQVSGVSALLSARPLVALGDNSYSWYLWHWPAIVFVSYLWPGNPLALVLAGVLSFAPAWLSRRYIEEPLRHAQWLNGRRVLGLVAVCVLVPLMANLGLRMGANQQWGNTQLQGYETERTEKPTGKAEGCLIVGIAKSSDLQRCEWTVPDSKGTIVLAGDSHADAYSTAVIAAGNALGYTVQSVTGSSCTVTGLASNNTDRVPNCAQLADWILDDATGGDNAALVILAHYSAARVAEADRNGADDPVGAWSAALESTVQRLSDESVPVILLQDVPYFGANGEACLHGALVALACDTDRAVIDKTRAPIVAAEQLLSERYSDVHVVDPIATFCVGSRCSAVRDGHLLFADSQHLNAAGGRMLAEPMQQWIGQALG
jgi:peptidoglycan/LPS O-acetylase OafA/YrhL